MNFPTFYKTKRNAFKVCKAAKEGALRSLLWKDRPKRYKVAYIKEKGWYIETKEPAGAILPGGLWINAAMFAAVLELKETDHDSTG